MEEKNWKVYIHTNLINKKRYIGITSKKPEHRWLEGRGYKDNRYFGSAIAKYGWDSFLHEVVFENLTREEAVYLEKLLIATFRTQDTRYGYNMTAGGDGTLGFFPSAETRAKLSEARRKENLSEETLRRRSEGLKGRRFSEEHKKKIGDGNSKAINMLTKDGEYIRSFRGASDAELELGISHSHISQCCTGKRKTTGGFMWEFAQCV